MIRIIISLAIAAASLCQCCAEQSVLGTKDGADADFVSKSFQNAKPRGKNEFSVVNPASRRKDKPTAEILAALKDDDILVDIGGVFRLKWGILRKHVEMLCKRLEYRPEMQASGNDAVKTMAFQSYCSKLLKDYIEHGVFAVEAQRIGIMVSEEEFKKYRQMARKKYAQDGERGRLLIDLMDSRESFYEYNLTNALYWKAYRMKEIEPKIELPEEDVQRFIKMRHDKNLNVLATNDLKRVLVGKILSEVQGGMDFGEAAEKWSDDDSSETKGVMMDDNGMITLKFERSDLDERISARCWNLKPGELSDVIETPYAWHIIKLLKRNPATTDAEETIEFAQIKLEKGFIEPEFSEQEARDRARSLILKSAMKMHFAELMKKTRIDSKIPLNDDKRNSDVRIRRIR